MTFIGFLLEYESLIKLQFWMIFHQHAVASKLSDPFFSERQSLQYVFRQTLDLNLSLKSKKERKKEKLFNQKQIEHPFSLGNRNFISDKNAVYEKEIVLILVQIWLPQLVVFFLVNRTFLWLFWAVFRGGHDFPFGQGSVCIVFHRRYEWCLL